MKRPKKSAFHWETEPDDCNSKKGSRSTPRWALTVDGLIMGSRTGEIDRGVLIYIADKEHLNFRVSIT
jgi:hypothetical protein